MAIPWERQRDDDGELEPWFWFDRFERFYLIVGPDRSLLGAYNSWRKEAQKGTTRSVATSWNNNATRWHWKERAHAWDEDQRRQRILEEEQDRAEARSRHLQLARGMQSVGGKRLRRLQDDVDQLSPGEARQYVKEGIGLERQAMGLPEHLIAVAAMSDDELLNRYRDLVAGIGGPGSGDNEPGAEAPADADAEAQPEG